MKPWDPKKRFKPYCDLLLVALLPALLFAGCASTERRGAAPSAPSSASSAPPAALGSPAQGAKVIPRTVGVVARGQPQLAMRAYQKDQVAEMFLYSLFGGLCAMLVTGSYELVYTQIVPQLNSFEDYFHLIPISGLIGAGFVGVAGMVGFFPAKRAEGIEGAVLPALSDFPFQKRMVEQIVAQGTGNTECRFVAIDPSDAQQDSREVDAILEVNPLTVGLKRAGSGIQLFAAVQAQLVEKGTGTPLAEKTFAHTWRIFGRDQAGSGDGSLTPQEVNDCLQVLSEDIVDTLFRAKDLPPVYSYGGTEKYSQALQPRSPRRENPLAKFEPPAVDTLQPTLEWAPFPGEKTGPVSYDLRIWKLADEARYRWELVYERRDVADPWHTVEQPLENQTTYYWAVRARLVRQGHAEVTPWTTIPGFLPRIDKEALKQQAFAFSFTTAARPAGPRTKDAED
jgi:hypothetical protein